MVGHRTLVVVLVDVGIAAVVVVERVAGIQPNGARVVGNGVVGVAEIVMGDAAIVPEVGVFRIEIDGAVEVRQGTLGVAFSPKHLAAIGQRPHIRGIGLEHGRAPGDALVLAVPVVIVIAPLACLRGRRRSRSGGGGQGEDGHFDADRRQLEENP
ncbi:hypothetical protein ABIF65_003614 [Bradyrhizobium japonicum]